MFKLNAYQLKWIAIVGMFLNHATFAWRDVLPMGVVAVMYAAGGVTFPILAYFIVEGYKHTSNLGKYMLRIFIFGVIAQPLHFILFGRFGLNIMFTILLSLIALKLYDVIKIRILFWLVFILIMVIAFVFMFDWIFIGPLLVLMYYIIPKEHVRRVVPAIVAGVIWFAITAFGILGIMAMQDIPELAENVDSILTSFGGAGADLNFMIAGLGFIVGCIAGAVLVKNFNSERGKKMKWAFYAAYPLHLALILIVAFALGLL
ncbi:MAG: conjugal transfer protein TraX [Defluviitaleaceae bacterium]|nr:conjugal transfer protein TraX [Defluviitaleaceae bacterium]